MKHVRGLITTDQALRHVFFHSPGSSLNITSQWTAPLLSLYQLRQRRNATGFSRFHRPDPAVKSPVLARQFGPRDSTFPTVDEEISDRVIRVVGENKTLSNPQELKQVLNSFDRKQYFLLQVSPPSNEIPVCKITEKKEVYARENEKAKAAKAARRPKNTVKRIELGWHVDSGDLEHKMDKMQEFLEEGRKVEVEVRTKKRRSPITQEMTTTVMKRIRERIKKVKGAQEMKPMTGEAGKIVTFFLERSSVSK